MILLYLVQLEGVGNFVKVVHESICEKWSVEFNSGWHYFSISPSLDTFNKDLVADTILVSASNYKVIFSRIFVMGRYYVNK